MTADTLKTVVALRAAGHIHIDGLLDEPEWREAPASYGFRQERPAEGEASTESTLVRILYDDEAIYFGCWCYDSEPDKIIKQLTRRDRFTASDRIAVEIDSHHDHQSGYHFDVNAAGVKRDILIYNKNNIDDTWDAVWEAETRITESGWTAEIKIPYSAIRFSPQSEYVWGFNMWRWIGRKDEFCRWQFVPASEPGGVAKYGHLTGIKSINPPGRLETLPYAVTYGITEPKSLGNPDGDKFNSNVGVDLKYSISSALTLDATINPDFGQVESDRSVMNLSTFETRFSEKRPFFLEGFEIFDTPFFEQFYSRRIGRPPYCEVEAAHYYIDYPNNTTILGAVKVTGKTKSNTSIGFLNAVTQEEKTKYRLKNDTCTYDAVVEPMANYMVARAKQDILGNSYVGCMITSAVQKERSDAYTASADWQVYFLNELFHTAGIVIGTSNGPGTGGMAAAVALNKSSGRIISGSIFFDYYDRKVNWNRLGFLSRNGIYEVSSWMQLRSDKQFSIFHYLRLNFNGWYNEHLDGYRMQNGGNINGNIGFTNGWWLWAGIGISPSHHDDQETRNNGLWKRPAGNDCWIGGTTSDVRKVQLETNYNHGTTRGGTYNTYQIWANFKPKSNLEFSIGPGYEAYRDMDYWVGKGTSDGFPVFGKLDLNQLDINLRGIYTFTKNLTIQWYSQFYFSAGKYDRFRRLVTVDSFKDIDDPENEIKFDRGDFNYKSLNLNLILRWEYLPGSSLYAVWTHERDGTVKGVGDFDFSRDFGDLFETPQTNTFLVKVNYWWNI
ncbi:MAG: carbohydrate binding family 9 domain-containing protein [Candidatus Zixiibacteriota bacterium]|nr:MAG: carbohydrate binding family 9 domain-containing protein [candidate division Zixibacteria bacterium]